jgi:hypothetical protein
MPEDEKVTNVRPGHPTKTTADAKPDDPDQRHLDPAIGQPGGEGPSESSQLGPHGGSDPNAEPLPGQPGYREAQLYRDTTPKAPPPRSSKS